MWKGTGGTRTQEEARVSGGWGGGHVKGDEAEDKKELGHGACLL